MPHRGNEHYPSAVAEFGAAPSVERNLTSLTVEFSSVLSQMAVHTQVTISYWNIHLVWDRASQD